MKSLHISFLLFIICLLFSCKQPLTKEEKNADAVYLEIKKEYSLNKDGSTTYHYYHRLKLNSYAALNELYGESFISYNPKFQELEIIKSVTHLEEGKKVAGTRNSFNEVLPFYAEKSAFHNHLREMVVSHIGLEPGCIIEFEYKIHSKKGFSPGLSDDVRLSYEVPVKKLILIVSTPPGVKLDYKHYRGSSKPEIKVNNAKKHLVWQFYNLDPYTKEIYQPDFREYLSFVRFASYNWEEVKNFFHHQPNYKRAVNESVFEELKKKSDMDTLQTILNYRDYVSNSINMVHVPDYLTAYKYRSPEDCWQSNSATQLEKAIMLKDFLAIIGLKASVIGLLPKQTMEHIANYKLLKKYMVALEYKNKTIVLSLNKSQSQNEIFNLSNYDILTLKGDFSTETENYNNQSLINGSFKIYTYGAITVNLNCKLINGANPYFALKKNKKNIKDLFNPWNIPLDKVYLKSYRSQIDTTSCDLLFYAPNAIKWKNGYYFLELPKWNTKKLDVLNNSLVDKRSTPFIIDENMSLEFHYTFDLPETWECLNDSLDIKISNEVGVLSIKNSIKGPRLFVTRNLIINKKHIETNEYNKLRALVNKWQNKNNHLLIFRKNKGL